MCCGDSSWWNQTGVSAAREIRQACVLTRADEEQHGVGQESNDLHPSSSVELVVDQERSEVVPAERDADVDEVPQPARHDVVLGRGGDDVDES